MGSYQSWFNRDKGHFWQKITEIGRTAARLSPCGPARSEEGFRDQAFPRWKEGGAAPSPSDFGDFLPQRRTARIEPLPVEAGPDRRVRRVPTLRKTSPVGR